MAVNAQKTYEIDIEDVEYIRHGNTQVCHGQLAARVDSRTGEQVANGTLSHGYRS